MMKLLATLFALLLLPVTGYPRLWDSPDQMIMRFGGPKKEVEDDAPFATPPGFKVQGYERAGISCCAYFENDKCVCEAFFRTDRDWLSQEQLSAVLKANEFDKPWTPRLGSDGTDYWTKGDKSARGVALKGPSRDSIRYVIFTVPRYDEAVERVDVERHHIETKESQFLTEEVVIPTPTQSPLLAPKSEAFRTDVTHSQRAAVAKYPALGIKGSPLNSKFLARLAEWHKADDPRLEHSDWPELLVKECAK